MPDTPSETNHRSCRGVERLVPVQDPRRPFHDENVLILILVKANKAASLTRAARIAGSCMLPVRKILLYTGNGTSGQLITSPSRVVISALWKLSAKRRHTEMNSALDSCAVMGISFNFRIRFGNDWVT